MLTNRQMFQLHMGLPSVVVNPIEIVKAEGIYLTDSEGKKLTDFYQLGKIPSKFNIL